ncbi:hypothetical protein CRUP_013493 [Coryphaenoides rupestris]|nr:hypothetical protein CRUP_013493 [Coryphaenoides rupestris]
MKLELQSCCVGGLCSGAPGDGGSPLGLLRAEPALDEALELDPRQQPGAGVAYTHPSTVASYTVHQAPVAAHTVAAAYAPNAGTVAGSPTTRLGSGVTYNTARVRGHLQHGQGSPTIRLGTEVTSTSIIISWSPTPHVGYKLTVRPSQGGEAPRDVTSDSGSIFITGLTPGVEYTYDIQPVLDGHEHGSTVTQRVVNPETGGVIVEWGGTDTPEVPQLTGLSDENVTDTAVGIRWSPFNSTVVTGDRITIDVGKGLLLCNRLSELLNPNYEDLSPGRGATALPATPEDSDTSPEAADEPERLTRVFEEPEYLNVPQSSLPRYAHNSLDNRTRQTSCCPPPAPLTVVVCFCRP